MPYSERIGLAATADTGDTLAERDVDQDVGILAATRTALATALGGEGIHRGAVPLVDTGVDGTKIEASSTPLVLAIADDSGYVFWFVFTADQPITFHASSGTLNLYATIHQISAVSPAMATGTLAAVTFQTAASPPAHSLLLGAGAVTASAFTSWTEDSGARRLSAAYTQTYSTADRTHAALTSATLTDSSGGTPGTTIADIGATYAEAEVANAVASLAAQCNALRVDLTDVKQLVNAIIDDLQARGLLG